jgi:5-methylcytosine-specific restriction endonuclease McrA
MVGPNLSRASVQLRRMASQPRLAHLAHGREGKRHGATRAAHRRKHVFQCWRLNLDAPDSKVAI